MSSIQQLLEHFWGYCADISGVGALDTCGKYNPNIFNNGKGHNCSVNCSHIRHYLQMIKNICLGVLFY